jgi:hypothetical protein
MFFLIFLDIYLRLDGDQPRWKYKLKEQPDINKNQDYLERDDHYSPAFEGL